MEATEAAAAVEAATAEEVATEAEVWATVGLAGVRAVADHRSKRRRREAADLGMAVAAGLGTAVVALEMVVAAGLGSGAAEEPLAVVGAAVPTAAGPHTPRSRPRHASLRVPHRSH
jgi:hypothetical protein